MTLSIGVFFDYMLHRFGFDYRWRRSMRTCVFLGSLSVLSMGVQLGKFRFGEG